MGLSVAEKIRLIMKRQKITMGDLAEASGQTRQNLSNKMARGNFTEKDITELAAALGCTVEIRLSHRTARRYKKRPRANERPRPRSRLNACYVYPRRCAS